MAFAGLLTKQQRTEFLDGLRTTALNKDGSEKNTRAWVSSFAPGSTRFVTTVVKVHGTMSAGSVTQDGAEVPQDPYSLATPSGADRYSCHATTRT